jgi:hypothetical protein
VRSVRRGGLLGCGRGGSPVPPERLVGDFNGTSSTLGTLLNSATFPVGTTNATVGPVLDVVGPALTAMRTSSRSPSPDLARAPTTRSSSSEQRKSPSRPRWRCSARRLSDLGSRHAAAARSATRRPSNSKPAAGAPVKKRQALRPLAAPVERWVAFDHQALIIFPLLTLPEKWLTWHGSWFFGIPWGAMRVQSRLVMLAAGLIISAAGARAGAITLTVGSVSTPTLFAAATAANNDPNPANGP